eukprot:Pgem_evm1s13265
MYDVSNAVRISTGEWMVINYEQEWLLSTNEGGSERVDFPVGFDIGNSNNTYASFTCYIFYSSGL